MRRALVRSSVFRSMLRGPFATNRTHRVDRYIVGDGRSCG
jgi:hypothetical protein